MLGRIREGISNHQIAKFRGTSLDAVKYHLANIRLKLTVASRDELSRWKGTPLIPLIGADAERWFCELDGMVDGVHE